MPFFKRSNACIDLLLFNAVTNALLSLAVNCNRAARYDIPRIAKRGLGGAEAKAHLELLEHRGQVASDKGHYQLVQEK